MLLSDLGVTLHIHPKQTLDDQFVTLAITRLRRR
jgi:hypothetical protein